MPDAVRDRSHHATPAPTPARLAAFLRGINLGGRRVKNAELAACFVGEGFAGVETYQASGNVVIDGAGEAAPGAPSEAAPGTSSAAPPDAPPEPPAPADLHALEVRIEAAVRRELGFETDAFVRSLDALAALVEHDQLLGGEAEGLTPHVIFLKVAPDSAVGAALADLEGPDDRFPVLDREILWLRRGRLSDSEVQPRHLEKALGGVPNTMRKVTTLRRMVRRFGARQGQGQESR